MAAAEAAHLHIWSQEDLRALHESLLRDRQIPQKTTVRALTSVLMEHGKLRDIELRRMSSARDSQVSRSKHRLIWENASAYQVGLSLRPRSYLSHSSAAAVHNLITSHEQPVYVNQEQSAKPALSGRLEQGAIDRAQRPKVHARLSL